MQEGKMVVAEAYVFQLVSPGLCSASTPVPARLPFGGELNE